MIKYRKIFTNQLLFGFAFLFGLFLISSPVAGVEIIAFGDSITKGTPYVEEREGDGQRIGGYEPELESQYKNAGAVFAYVYNWGVGGEDTYNGSLRIDDVLDNYSSSNIDYVLLLEGTNDIKEYSINTTIFYLESMINECQERGIRVILGNLLPDTANGSEKEKSIPNVYNPEIKKLAERKNIPLADHYSAMVSNWSKLTDDGTHPNREGYRAMAAVWFDILNEPTVTTLPAENVSASEAVINGIINPNLLPTSYYFEYGYNTEYGGKTEIIDAGSGGDEISVSASLEKLSENKTYHYRIVAYNTQKTVAGEDLTFQTTEGPSSSGCFIATAAYGSAVAPHVAILKQFRDRYLVQTDWGRSFIAFYYRHSPPIADFLEQKPILKIIVRLALYPLVGISAIMINGSVSGKAVFLLLVISGILFFVYLTYQMYGHGFINLKKKRHLG